MRTVIRAIACFVFLLSANIVPAQQSLPTSDALRDAHLTVWISSGKRPIVDWDFFLRQLHADYPSLQLDWQAFEPNKFLPAFTAARQSGQAPDIVFVDNVTQLNPMKQTVGIRMMVGGKRIGGNGWWMILKASQNQSADEAFFTWILQPKDWHPTQPKTQLLTDSDRSAIHSIAKQTIEAFNRLPVQPPDISLDPDIAAFAWNQIRQPRAYPDTTGTYTPIAYEIGGNAQLAFVMVTSTERGETSLGMLHSFLVLRKVDEAWKLLLLIPDSTEPAAEQWIKQFDDIELTNNPSQETTSIDLVEPTDNQSTTRYPKTDLVFYQRGPTAALLAIESQYGQPNEPNGWSPTNLYRVWPAAKNTNLTRMPTPFGIGAQPHRWRVWSINKSGVVTLSEWRTVNFTN